jgi:hypothetical protein
MWDIIETLLPYVATGAITFVGGYLGRYLQERIHRSYEVRQAHFQAIKEKVFDRLIKQLDTYYIPIFEQKAVGIEVERKPIREDRSIAERPVSDYKLASKVKEAPALENDDHLYEDAEVNHFPELTKRWEGFKAAVRKYCEDCLTYAEELRRGIVERVKLPVCQYGHDYNGEKWLDAYGLAVLILRRQLGDESAHVNKFKDGSSSDLVLLRDWSRDYTRGTSEGEVNQCLTIIDDLRVHDSRSRALCSAADGLKTEATSLKKGLNGLKLLSKLPGDCPYCEV